ncbi:unnamed protein product [Clonostachys rosea]|uniref:EF-hand domain-containing protein n=1 Tax=Bionectria ochroleuca TaxID=29856 RepID=A0ABY6UTD3_BIOOC|nr:unnamed protein product [Clonostachys rosea]
MTQFVGRDILKQMETHLLENEAIKQVKIVDVADAGAPYQDLVLGYVLSDSASADDDEPIRLAYEGLIAKMQEAGGARVVPETWRRCDIFPRDASGEIDEEALRVALSQNGGQEVPYETDEDKILRIIAEVLHVSQDKLNRSQSFFQNGGNADLAKAVSSQLMMLDVALQVPQIVHAESLDELPSLVIAKQPSPMVTFPPTPLTARMRQIGI